MSRSGPPQIINVSPYVPKEKQRDGRSYSVNDVSALRAQDQPVEIDWIELMSKSSSKPTRTGF